MKQQFDKLMATSTRKLLLIGAVCLGLAPYVQATTLVYGNIGANTTWALAQSPYQVIADVSVENGAILSIEAGVVVTFDAAKSLTVNNGALNARGTSGQPILFTSSLDTPGHNSPAPGDWGQIRFLNGTDDTATVIEHTQVRYGHGIDVRSAAPTFNYLNINNNLGAAIAVDLDSSPKGVGNQASRNTLNGVSVPAGDVRGSVTWGIKGIPYVVASGVVSIGNKPELSSLSIDQVQQGETVNAIISGTRLAGAQNVDISTFGTTGIVQNGATDTSVPVQLTVAPDAMLGVANVELQVAAGLPKLTGALQIIQPQPTINTLDPGSIYAVQMGKVLNVVGKNFGPLSVIRVDGTDMVTTYGDTASLSTTLPEMAAGNKSITVAQPDPLNAGGILVSKPTILNVVDPVLTLTPKSVSQSKTLPLNVTLSIPLSAGVGGVTVNLSSSDPAVASVPASVTIAEGARSELVNVSAVGVGSATITASVAGFVDATSILNLSGRKPLIPVLTSPASASSVGVASASSSYNVAPFGVASAFDNDLSTRWSNTTTALGHWLKWSFVTAHAVAEFEYSTRNLLYTQLQYSDDDVNWFSASAVYQEGQGSFVHPATTGTTPHRYWRLYVSKVYGVTMGNWYGYEEFQLYD